MQFSKAWNFGACFALLALSQQTICAENSANKSTPENLACSKEDFESHKDDHANLMKQGNFTPVATVLTEAVKAGFKGKNVKINIKYDRSGKVIDAALDETTGYSKLDAALVNFGKEIEVSKGKCGIGVMPIALRPE